MENVNYFLSGGLVESQLKKIYKETLLVLEKVGVEINHEGILKLLSTYKGIKVDGNRVYYSTDIVEKFIQKIKSQNAEYSYNRHNTSRFTMVPPYMPLNYMDIDTEETRLATAEDLKNAVKICDAYQMYGPSPIHLQTVPQHLHQIATFKICIENSQMIGGYTLASSMEEAEYMCLMGQIAGREPPYVTLEIPISPLRLNFHALELIYNNRIKKHNLKGICLGGGAVPMAGATAPIFFPGMLIQGMAEALAAYITPKLIDPEVYSYCSFGGFLFDLKKMTPSFPFPESILYCNAVRQVINYVIGEMMGVAFGGTIDNIQGMFKLGFSLAVGALAGAKTFLSAGATSGGAFSPVHLVIHSDIVSHVEKFMQGFEVKEEGLSFQTIQEGIVSGMFLDHPSTLEYRKIYLEPKLFFKYENFLQLKEEAKKIAKEKIAQHNFYLEEKIKKELDRIYQEASDKLVS